MVKNNNRTYDIFLKEIGETLARIFPAERSINRSKIRKRQSKQITNGYFDFLSKVKTPDQVTDLSLKLTRENDIRTTSKKTDFYHYNKERTNFAVVRYGDRPLEDGLRILFAHTDSPCLRVKPKPLLLNWDPELRDHYPGVLLDTFHYGGVPIHQWFGLDVLITGTAVRNGRSRKINLPGFIMDHSIHIDTREFNEEYYSEAFPADGPDVVTGYPSRQSLISKLGFESEDDFGRAKIYVVPRSQPLMIPNYIIGYGHDNRIGVYTALRALFEAEPKHTTVLFCLDREEVGELSGDSSAGHYIDDVLYQMIAAKNNIDIKNITDGMLRTILRKSIAINTDVTVSSGGIDIDKIDQRNAAKMGYGVVLTVEDGSNNTTNVSQFLVDYFMDLLNKAKITYQVCGSFQPVDDLAYQETYNNLLLSKGTQTINLGMGIANAHGVLEIACIHDLYWAVKAYKAFIESTENPPKA
ncbi:hypothetical protein DRJ17_06010 [Candidatus Woesearchaeota archaeon]|nr:MAG: hypothetical protein DRJ17_06010 [Candidatus Woesearchaeota archaeon]